ncbi:ATP-dependent Clp protease adaptor ClpS [Bradyrhizobium sp. WSM 1738]|uniref:ATP-dependent Clp protease adaptor ClpS n=1 Tax=Bradyrhizobium hereditatis TaxID=2821405 RepID=UPI001CE29481|nr:ATP-dependent Clp protease adaptor ClpS [Bradyrhizobium hereditatis]MCA6115446.1 ATP-dependent Clp protease adaptor ClpS [Bradyrhizobium hereditatis]
MNSIQIGYARLVIHDDKDTPQDFVISLLRTVFSQSLSDAIELMATIEMTGKAVCGTYPRAVADALLQASQERIQAAGHRLVMTAEVSEDGEPDRCRLCGSFAGDQICLLSNVAPICDDCTLAVANNIGELTRTKQFNFASAALEWHFAGIPRDQLIATSRQFPGHMRPEVQAAVDKLFSASPIRFFGIHERYRYETLTFASLNRFGETAHAIAPAQYQEVEIGEAKPVKCLENGLWLCATDGDLHYAVLLSAHREHGEETGVRIEILAPAGPASAELVKRSFSEIEKAVDTARCYRGKVLSFDADASYRGRSRGLMVHKLPRIERASVILPEATLKLLDRNVLNFVEGRAQLRRLGQSTRKGILLYGPPGTGKTHTIRYLASNLAGHTTLIITAGQIGLLGAYMNLARLLQPTMVVIEDADLIARNRETMGPCEETLLNRLLNEMDGLKEDADILFVLTTNRPEQLEGALANRPGRIDQAIEIPLPDEVGRRKLIQLYGKGLALDETLVSEATHRTKGVSAAFIKELMRRTAQASIDRDGGTTIRPIDLGEALDDMLFASGKLNVKLLGGKV